MKKSAKFLLSGLIVIGILVINGCAVAKAPLIEPDVLEGAEKDAVIEMLKPTADSLLKGFINNDYALFSKDFNDEVRKGMDQSAFDALTKTFTGKLGQFQSSEITTVLQETQYLTLVYSLIYDGDSTVVMRVVFSRTDPPKIVGIWFDSPVLTQ